MLKVHYNIAGKQKSFMRYLSVAMLKDQLTEIEASGKGSWSSSLEAIHIAYGAASDAETSLELAAAARAAARDIGIRAPWRWIRCCRTESRCCRCANFGFRGCTPTAWAGAI